MGHSVFFAVDSVTTIASTTKKVRRSVRARPRELELAFKIVESNQQATADKNIPRLK